MPWRYNSSRREIVVVALMLACSVMSYFDRTIMSIAGPQIMKEFDLSETQMGSVYSAFILSYAIMMIPGGRIVDRLGPRLTLLLMNLSAALFTGLTALGGKPVPVTLDNQVSAITEEMGRQTGVIVQKKNEMAAVSARYEADKRHWQEIKADQARTAAAESAVSTSSKPSAAKAPGGASPTATR